MLALVMVVRMVGDIAFLDKYYLWGCKPIIKYLQNFQDSGSALLN